MALRTLDEINRAFISDNSLDSPDSLSESSENGQKIKRKPITPLVIEVEKPLIRMKNKSEKSAVGQNPHRHPNKNRGLLAVISDTLFSLAIVMVLLVVLLHGSNGGEPKTFFNYSYFTVLTPSMQDEIPQGSLIIVKKTDPLELKTGDNITFMVDRSMSVTHKIVNIYENYNNSGARGFQTQGVNNANPDRDIVCEANVVGKVVLVLPLIGIILIHLSENVFYVFVIFGLCMLLSFLLRGLFAKQSKQIRQIN